MQSVFSSWLFTTSNLLKIPKSIILTVLSILSIGLLLLYSASKGSMYPYVYRQILAILFSIGVAIFIICSDFYFIKKFAYLTILPTIFLLILTLIFGKKTMGASRWLDFGICTLQPSEIAKLSVILFVSHFFSKIKVQQIYNFIGTLIQLFIVLSPIILLVVIQPDLATSIILVAIITVMVFSSGITVNVFILTGLSVIITSPFVWLFLLKPYQKLRITNFLNPENDPSGSGYNVIQAKIAIGSGGLTGKGFLKGTQGQLNFLPEHHTDFIFSVLCEEFGFIGASILLGLYCYIIYYSLKVFNKAQTVFERMICIGCSSLFFFHLFINTGMTVGLLPVAGIPLLMVSYGGTGVLVGLICIALLVKIDIQNV